MAEQNVGPKPPSVRFEMEDLLAGARSTWSIGENGIGTTNAIFTAKVQSANCRGDLHSTPCCDPPLALRYVQNGVIASYYEWAVVGIIASYTEENNGTLPQSWNDLRGYEYHSVQTPSLRSIDEAMRYVSIDFEELSRFRNSEGKDSGLPIISTKKGMNVHWVDPKYELKKFFRTGELPDGALRRSEADERRKHFEKREYKEY